MSKSAAIDLFAGIGGIRLGFENAFGDDIETVFVSEWDEWAARTYRENLHVVLLAKLAGDRPEHAGADRVELRVDEQDRKSVV